MDTALVRRQPLHAERYVPSEASSGGFHLQFVNPPINSGFGEDDINTFLRRIFQGPFAARLSGVSTITEQWKGCCPSKMLLLFR